jgi:hypothetical protein
MQVQYVTDEQGKQVGVLLNMAAYQQLTATADDPELLLGLSHDELKALANSKLAPGAQSQLDDLLAKQKESPLSTKENELLDNLLAQVDQLTILKTRARYTLREQQAVH